MATLTPSNFHPTLSVPLTESFLDPPPTCTAHVLLSLPPALFLDPWQTPVSTANANPNTHQPHPGVNASASDENPTQPGTIIAAHYLGPGGEGGKGVELEKAVGWTTIESSKRREKKTEPHTSASGVEVGSHHHHNSDGDEESPYETITRKKFVAGEGIVEETVKVLRQGHHESDVENTSPPSINTYSPPRKSNRLERETILFDVATKPQEGTIKRALKNALSVADSTQLVDATGQPVDTIQLAIPLHARYLPPLDGDLAATTSITALLQHSFAPLRSSTEESGNYNDVTIEGLEAFWACTKPQSSLDADPAWEQLTRASSLLAPSHKHLTAPLHRRLPHTTGSTTFLYRATHLHSHNLTIQLPVSDASYAVLTSTLTQTLFCILALALFAKIYKVN